MDLNWNSIAIEPWGANIIDSALIGNQSLRVADLNGTQIGNKGAWEILANALKFNTWIKSLHLPSDLNISDSEYVFKQLLDGSKMIESCQHRDAPEKNVKEVSSKNEKIANLEVALKSRDEKIAILEVALRHMKWMKPWHQKLRKLWPWV